MVKPVPVPSINLQSSQLTLSEYRPSKAGENDHDPYVLDFIFSNDTVQYKCSCGHFRRLYATYFCRHCMALRCRGCIAHEVDSQYCQQCLEYIPTIDPKFQMNKCASCYLCPNCQHLLSTSILSTSSITKDQQGSDQQTEEILKRTCQLVCEFCRWSSDSFVTEGPRIINNIADVEVENSSRISELFTYYKALSEKEKADKKKKRRVHSRSGNTMDLLKKYKLDRTFSPKLYESLRARTMSQDKSALSAKCNLEIETTEESIFETFKPSEPVEADDLDKLDTDFFYSKNFNLEEISSIEQRLAQVELQPDRVADLKPINKSLSVKRSLRCKECDRNLCRSEYSPVNIRFKIQSSAYYYLPEIKLRSDSSIGKVKVGEYNIVEFKVQNQTLSNIKLKFDVDPEKTEEDMIELKLPKHELSLGPKDDTADYEHVPLDMRPLNEETQVTFQSPFKIGFFIKVKPNKDYENLFITFQLSHDIMLLQNPKETSKVERINQIIRVNLGPTKSS